MPWIDLFGSGSSGLGRRALRSINEDFTLTHPLNHGGYIPRPLGRPLLGVGCPHTPPLGAEILIFRGGT